MRPIEPKVRRRWRRKRESVKARLGQNVIAKGVAIWHFFSHVNNAWKGKENVRRSANFGSTIGDERRIVKTFFLLHLSKAFGSAKILISHLSHWTMSVLALYCSRLGFSLLSQKCWSQWTFSDLFLWSVSTSVKSYRPARLTGQWQGLFFKAPLPSLRSDALHLEFFYFTAGNYRCQRAGWSRALPLLQSQANQAKDSRRNWRWLSVI